MTETLNVPAKSTQLIASHETKAFLGKLGPFLAERSGVDYLLVYNNKDFDGVPAVIDPEMRPKGETKEAREARMGRIRTRTVEQTAIFGEKNLRDRMPNDLRDLADQMPSEDKIAFYAGLADVGASRNKAIKYGHGENSVMYGSPASSTTMLLPNGKTVGLIEYDANRANRMTVGFDMPKNPRAVPIGQPGQYSDETALIILHELGHIRARSSGAVPFVTLYQHRQHLRGREVKSTITPPQYYPRQDETVADTDGMKLYLDAHDQGLVQSTNATDTHLAGRLYSTFSNFDGQNYPIHSTAHQIIAGGIAHPAIPPDPKVDRDFQEFMRKLDRSIGRGLLDRDLELDPNLGWRPEDISEKNAQDRLQQRVTADRCQSAIVGAWRRDTTRHFHDDLDDLAAKAEAVRTQFGMCVRLERDEPSIRVGLRDMRSTIVPNSPDETFANATEKMLSRKSADPPKVTVVEPIPIPK